MDSSLSLLLPCGNSSTCTSCKRRWRVGGLWAVDDQAAWRGQHPEEARGSYEPAPAWVKRANRTYSSINTSPRLLHGIRWLKKKLLYCTFTAQKCSLGWLKMLWYFQRVQMGWISWLMFMINPRKNSSASLHLTFNQHMYWPGVRSCHRGWRTSAKSSCLRGGWWQEIWPLGSFASLLQYADNPSRKKKKMSKITGGTQVKHITLLFLPLMQGPSSLNARAWTHVRKVHFKTSGATVGAGALLHVRADHVSTNQALTFLCIITYLN